MRYLVAVDGSAQSTLALDRAIEAAGMADASLIAVHVVTPEVHVESVPRPVASLSEAEQLLVVEDPDTAERRGDALLEAARERATVRGRSLDVDLLYGDPAEAIVRYAAEHDVDAIYVGHRGLADRHEALVGSVATDVVRSATVPVLVVR